MGLCWLALSACGSTHVPGAGNGETHFLDCHTDAECGAGLRCHEGHCAADPSSERMDAGAAIDGGGGSGAGGKAASGGAGSGTVADSGLAGATAGGGGEPAASKPDAGSPVLEACTLPPDPGTCEAYISSFYYDPLSRGCEAFHYGGCDGNANRFATREACEQACAAPAADPCSIEAEDPSLPGVRIRIMGPSCSVKSGKRHFFGYTVELDEPITITTDDSGGSCGRCTRYSEDPLTLVTTSIGDGVRQYCECDLGCCPPTVSESITLQTGSFSGLIDWPGVEWHGPSDTNAPLGAPFPAGEYAVSVMLVLPGLGQFEVQLPIRVTEP